MSAAGEQSAAGEGTVISADDPRTGQLAGNLAALRERVAAAAAAAGRDPAEVSLIAVTKTYPAADVVRLARLGLVEIGENRDQEAAPKADEVAAAGVAVRWHFVGRLQRNKARSVTRYADLVHTVDSTRLAGALASAATAAGRELPVLVQLSIDGDLTRGGVPAAGLWEVAEAVAAAPSLRLGGVMAVAPIDWSAAAAFGALADTAARLRSTHPGATIISAGMSGDLEAALASGATHLRIGSALLGKRDNLR